MFWITNIPNTKKTLVIKKVQNQNCSRIFEAVFEKYCHPKTKLTIKFIDVFVVKTNFESLVYIYRSLIIKKCLYFRKRNLGVIFTQIWSLLDDWPFQKRRTVLCCWLLVIAFFVCYKIKVSGTWNLVVMKSFRLMNQCFIIHFYTRETDETHPENSSTFLQASISINASIQ